MRSLAVVNPNAGGLRRRRIDGAALRRLATAVDDVVHTEGPGHATRIAREAAGAGYRRLVAVGGDGTVAEVLTGMDRSTQQLAVVPGGTGNCLAIALGVGSVARALHALAGAPLHPVDLIEATLQHSDGGRTRRLLGSTAGMGYSSDVAQFAKRRLSPLGTWAYALAAPLVRPQARMVELSIDDGPALRVPLTGVLVNNTRDIGVGRPFPGARIDDGLLDAVLFERGWLRQCLHDIQLVTGVPVPGSPSPRTLRRLRLRFAGSEVVMLDGDLFASVTALTLDCLPRAVQCVRLRR